MPSGYLLSLGTLNADIANSSLLNSPASDLNDLVQQYDSVLSSVLNSQSFGIRQR